ncbi:hypothetical protein FOVG_05458 [Fusarium oxysporum f. sp. pisi HDV247]|uniref:F-box domain-containing protein n=1 Tax=Fusarium oxysporum f. sp. pisi HDV247 TaxID=1080344 RepID=W9Q0J4_FUSOX|nr:hypothetical protein FOVG_05458 [Fusarium oxysporum f. sp. pisi HDV247]
MASSSTTSTPQLSNDLPRLPLEIWIQIFDNLVVPQNIQSLISASPTAYGYFQGGKSYILRPFVTRLNNNPIFDADIIALLLSAARVIKVLYKTPGLTLSEIGDTVSAFLNPLFRPDTPNPFREWDQSLSAIIEVAKGYQAINCAVALYKTMRAHPAVPPASNSELKKVSLTFMRHTILLDLSTYRNGTLFNPNTSILDPVAWQAVNPNLKDPIPKLWQRSLDNPGGWVVSDRGLVHVVVDIAVELHRPYDRPY